MGLEQSSDAGSALPTPPGFHLCTKRLLTGTFVALCSRTFFWLRTALGVYGASWKSQQLVGQKQPQPVKDEDELVALKFPRFSVRVKAGESSASSRIPPREGGI